MRQNLWVSAVVLLASAVFAPPVVGQRGPPPRTRDSVGIAIVENPAPSRTSIAFELDLKPLVTVPGTSSGIEYELTTVPAAFVLSDNRLVIAEAGTRQIRYFDAAGKHLSTSGRTGAGPGEFPNIADMLRASGDTLLVRIASTGNLSIWDHKGTFVRSVHLPGSIQCCFADGSVLAGSVRGSPMRAATGGAPAAAQRVSSLYLRYTLGSDPVMLDTIGVFDGNDPGMQVTRSQRGASGAIAQSVQVIPPPFGRISSVRVQKDRVLFADGSTFEIRIYSEKGKLVRIVRAATPVAKVTPKDIQDYNAKMEEGQTGDALRATRQLLSTFKFPATIPAFRRVEFDALGRIWAEEYPPTQGSEGWWTVFATDGRLLGMVKVPSTDDARLLSVGTDRVVLRSVNRDGEPVISVFRLKPVAAR